MGGKDVHSSALSTSCILYLSTFHTNSTGSGKCHKATVLILNPMAVRHSWDRNLLGLHLLHPFQVFLLHQFGFFFTQRFLTWSLPTMDTLNLPLGIEGKAPDLAHLLPLNGLIPIILGTPGAKFHSFPHKFRWTWEAHISCMGHSRTTHSWTRIFSRGYCTDIGNIGFNVLSLLWSLSGDITLVYLPPSSSVKSPRKSPSS